MSGRTGRRRVNVAMLGARLHYAVPRLLCEEGLLHKFYTDIFIKQRWLRTLLGAIPTAFRTATLDRLSGRAEPTLPADKVVSFALLGLRNYWQRKRARNTSQLTEVFVTGAKAFARQIIRQSMDDVDMLWCLRANALELFQYAKARDVLCVLEQASAPRRVGKRLLLEEIASWPEWQPSLTLDGEEDLIAEREEEEWKLADRIVVPSNFVMQGLSECSVPKKKCHLVAYGVDLSRFPAPHEAQRRTQAKLRVLFVGEVGLLKGVPYLLEALRLLGARHVDGRLVGRRLISPEVLNRYRDVARAVGAVPRSRMTEHFYWADVLVLPSLCEGSATVTYEALACGVPVVTTPNSGSLVRDVVDGHIVPIRSAAAVASTLEKYICDPSYLASHQSAAREGRARLGLQRYRRDLVRVAQI